MDFNLKQWRRQDESELQHSVKIPKLLLEPHPQPEPTAFVLPLFVPKPNTKTTFLTPFSDSSPSSPSSRSFPRMWGYFSLAQRQELELQALIFRYILAGAAVPSELLQPIKKSLLHSPPYFFHHPLQPQSLYQTAYLQPGYWGRAAMDPEPGRCRRTDGKKWRCSRDVVSGHKYCERHVHRGRNRSRKPVETTSTTNSIATAGVVLANVAGVSSPSDAITVDSQTLVTAASSTLFGLSRPSPSVELHHLNHSYCHSKTDISNAGKSQYEDKVEDGKSDGHVLRHFFDDWPRSFQNSNDGGNSSTGQMNSATSLSISTPRLPFPSDVSLKLSTGGVGSDQLPGSWGGWAAGHMASVGGPLAEALRSVNSYSSPTSVLHQPPRCSASETSVVTS